MNLFWSIPPRAKIFEALSAVADGRVTFTGDRQTNVKSSAGTKSYIVEWNDDVSEIAANDNASYYRGYLGYPIVATLLVLGKLKFDSVIAGYLRGIAWKAINTKYKNSYDRAIDEVLSDLESHGICRRIIEEEVDRILAQLGVMSFRRPPTLRRPPTD